MTVGRSVIDIDGLQVRLHPKYVMGMSALRWGSPGVTVIDDGYVLLEGQDYEAVAGFCPITGVPQVGFEQALFYVHCLSYELDLPICFARTATWSPTRVQPVYRRRRPRPEDDTFDPVREALLVLTDQRLGDLKVVEFPRPAGTARFDLPLTSMYRPVDEMVRMYSSALRQLDPMSEYLHYYRVIEHADGSNGVAWLKGNLGRLRAFDFGKLWACGLDPLRKPAVVNIDDPGPYDTSAPPEIRKNLLSIYKRKAVNRLACLHRLLQSANPPTPIERYLYNVQRCGIAHGKTGIKTYDFRYDLAQAAKDVYLIKMLARMAIEDRVPPSARPRR